jgi:hypothetical protein
MSARKHIVRRVPAGALLVATGILMGSCLYIPTAQEPAAEGTEVRQEQLAFLQPMATTKGEVIQRFGNPTFFWRDENILVYRWVKKKGVLLWAVAAGYSASFGAADIAQEQAFLLKFDRADRLVGSEILVKPMMKSYGDFLLEWRDAQRARNSPPRGAEP